MIAAPDRTENIVSYRIGEFAPTISLIWPPNRATRTSAAMIEIDGRIAKTSRNHGAILARVVRPRPYVERRLFVNSDRIANPRPRRGPS
jgi:hypothetical protein